MFDDLNLGKLPQIYDHFKSKGYTHSFNQFLNDLFSLLSKYHTLIDYQNNNLVFNIPHFDTNLQQLIFLLTVSNTLESELNIYQNEELTLAKRHLSSLSSWSKKNNINLPNSISIDSFRTLHQKLNSLSHFFTLHE